MKINPFIFRAYDIRGIYGTDITEEIFQKIGFVIGKNGKRYLVGNDIRKSGKSLACALISGILAKKGKIIYATTGSFGQILFSGWKKKVDFTLFVTASHLPAEWNGLKIFKGDGEPISPETIKDDVLSLAKKSLYFKKAKIKEINLKKEYINFLIKKFSIIKKAKLKVVLDCGGGSVSLVAPVLFKKLGLNVIELFCKPDPEFSQRDPEPKEENVQKLIERVKKEKADFGVAFDGDGDRGIIIDDKGRYLKGDQLAIIFSKEILKKAKRKLIVKTVSCTMALEEEVKKNGGKTIEVPVGHTFVISTVKKEKACLGIEETGHTVFPQYFLFDDAILIPLKLSEILIKKKKKLSQIVNTLNLYPFEELIFKCEDEKKFKVIKSLAKKLKRKYCKVNTLDGVKVYFPEGWVLVRASNTAPKIKLYVEAKNKQNLEKLKKEFSNILTKCIQQ